MIKVWRSHCTSARISGRVARLSLIVVMTEHHNSDSRATHHRHNIPAQSARRVQTFLANGAGGRSIRDNF